MYDQSRPENKVISVLSNLLDTEYTIYPVGTYAPFTECDDTKRPDVVLHHGRSSISFILEVDENHHSRYDTTCEMAKVLNYSQSLLATPGVQRVVVTRINPDAYGHNKVLQRINLAERVVALSRLTENIVEEWVMEELCGLPNDEAGRGNEGGDGDDISSLMLRSAKNYLRTLGTATKIRQKLLIYRFG